MSAKPGGFPVQRLGSRGALLTDSALEAAESKLERIFLWGAGITMRIRPGCHLLVVYILHGCWHSKEASSAQILQNSFHQERWGSQLRGKSGATLPSQSALMPGLGREQGNRVQKQDHLPVLLESLLANGMLENQS